MIISHHYKYIFVELPYTASTTIHEELCKYYCGEPILWKHAKYHNFLKTATEDEKEYFVFSCIRNPMDLVVSTYLKFKLNHKGKYTDPDKLRKNGGVISERMLKRFYYTQEEGIDFPDYLYRFFKIPYDNWSSLAHHKFDSVIRFERLQKEFAEVLDQIGIQQERQLPVINQTESKVIDFLSYYKTDKARKHSIRVFGPFMRKWGYIVPPDWELPRMLFAEMNFQIFSHLRKFYWRFGRQIIQFFTRRYKPGGYAKETD